MKNLILLLISMFVLLSTAAFGGIINVDPNIPDALKTALDAAVDGDIFVLARDGVYPISVELETHASLTITASEGTGAKPKLVKLANAEGRYPKEGMIRFYGGSVTIRNIFFEGADGDLAPWGNKILFPVSDMEKFHLDGVVITNARGGINSEAGIDTVVVENCLFLNFMCYQAVDGRFIDWRKQHYGSIRLQNNTFVFGQGFALAKWAGYLPKSSQCQSVVYDHNTIMNVWGAGPPCNQVTNNLIVNGSMLGSDQITNNYTYNARNGYFTGETMIVDSLWQPGVVDILGPQGAELFTADMTDSANSEIVMQNNNVHYTDDLTALWASTTHTTEPYVYGNQWASCLKDTVNTYYKEKLTFGKAPAPPINLVQIIMANKDTMSLGGDPWVGVEPRTGFTSNFEELSAEELDLSYNTDSKSYTQAAGGFPVGDLNWFPDKKQEWIAAGKPTTVDVSGVNENEIAALPAGFSLSQNYPNPFNPSTCIEYQLIKSELVKLTVYNVLGKAVKTLINEKQTSGAKRITWDGTNDVGDKMVSGIYYYRLEAGGKSKTKKMVLLK
jgi:hypothetical protein